jgi:acyl carrier protein
VPEPLQGKVREIVRRVLGPEINVEEARLELSSLKMLELIVALEEEFDIHISEDAPLARITTSVETMVAYLRKAHQLE